MEFIAGFFFLMTKWPVIPFLITALFLLPPFIRPLSNYIKPKSKFWLTVEGIIWLLFSLLNLWPLSNEMLLMLLKVWVIFPMLLVLTVNALILIFFEASERSNSV